jgi:TonB family protein
MHMKPRRAICALVCVVGALTAVLVARAASSQSSRGLESFVVTLSDYRIFDVQPRGADLGVRAIQMQHLEEVCWTRAVRAYEVILPDTSIDLLAGRGLCSLSQARVDAAVERSRARTMHTRDGIPWGTFFDSVVAICSGRQKRLVIDYGGANWSKPSIDPERLRDVDSSVYQMWTLGERLAAKVSPLAPPIESQERQGTSAAADLVGGRYDAAFRDMCWDGSQRTLCAPAYWRQLLGDYSGPPKHRGPLPPEVLNRESLRLSNYVTPVYPPIALSARITGDVRLELHIDRGTGDVTEAVVLAGRQLLDQAALAAARQWRFDAGMRPETLQVTIRFDLKCPDTR